MYDIEDDYEHLDENLEYVLENVLPDEINKEDSEEAKQLVGDYNSILMNGCSCGTQKEKRTRLCCDTSCQHGRNYVLHQNSMEIVLDSEKQDADLIYECTAQCNCPTKECRNRLVQFGPRKYLEIIDSPQFKSKGLKTLRDIPKGAFICEYAGELLTPQMAQRRLEENELRNQMNYILCLNEMTKDSSKVEKPCHRTIVDPSRRGNIGRYLNHSCEPNCELISVRIDCPVPKIAIFARRNIESSEELCFHYGGGIRRTQYTKTQAAKHMEAALKPCLCGSKSCENFLPNLLL